MPSESEARQIPVRVKMRMEAVGLWAFLSIPSIAVTVCLFVANFGSSDEDEEVKENAMLYYCGASFICFLAVNNVNQKDTSRS